MIVRWLTGQPSDLVKHIDQYLMEADQGDRTIYVSTIAMAEIRPEFLKAKKIGSIFEFFDDFKSAFRLIGPTPDIMARSAHLKGFKYTKKGTKADRVVGTADAIHLMTCLHAKEDLGADDIVFHTFDEGKGKTWEGKCAPLIKFEEWCEGIRDNPLVAKVIALPRCKPEHPAPKLGLDDE